MKTVPVTHIFIYKDGSRCRVIFPVPKNKVSYLGKTFDYRRK